MISVLLGDSSFMNGQATRQWQCPPLLFFLKKTAKFEDCFELIIITIIIIINGHKNFQPHFLKNVAPPFFSETIRRLICSAGLRGVTIDMQGVRLGDLGAQALSALAGAQGTPSGNEIKGMEMLWLYAWIDLISYFVLMW